MEVGLEEQELIEWTRSELRSLQPVHCWLLDLCIKRRTPGEYEPLSSNGRQRTADDLQNLIAMVEIEFLAGVEQCLKGGGEGAAGTIEKDGLPRPLDVFLMKISMDQRNSCRPLAVYCPVGENEFVWYDGFSNTYTTEELHPNWRVCSLSGTAKVLTALQTPLSFDCLLSSAMDRHPLVEAIPLEDMANSGKTHFQQLLSSDLNDSQKQAVATSLPGGCFDKGFFVIQGPPGCGSVQILLQTLRLAPNEPLLVAAPSNAAVANIALKFYSYYSAEHSVADTFQDVLVLGGNVDTRVHFLSAVHRGDHCRILFDEWEKETKHCNERKRDLVEDEKRKQLLQWLQIVEPDQPEVTFSTCSEPNRNVAKWSLSDLAQLCPYIDMSSSEGRSRDRRVISQARVVFTTLNGLGSRRLMNVKASTIFVDEAGQCSEADFYVAATFPKVKRMIVMGDPKQLPATVLDSEVARAGFAESWMGNVFQHFPHQVHLLDTQYRMDPEILAFPNKTFYRGRIRSGDNVLGRQPPAQNPFVFVDTDRKGQEQRNGFSYINSFECFVVKRLLFCDPDISRLICESETSVKIIIICPYKAQVQRIKDTIKIPRNCTVEVATVDSFQGQEGDVVVVSTVRTHRTGFVDDARRINVALTRAKRLLRVVGDLEFFVSISSKVSTLRKLACFAQQKQLVEKTPLKAEAWSRPNWDQRTLFRPSFTPRFHYCLQKMSPKDQNITLNTVLSLAAGREKDLSRIRDSQEPGWYVSYLKTYRQHQVVWIAKCQPPTVEAVFAGPDRACRCFIQKYHDTVPADACVMLPSLKYTYKPKVVFEEQNVVGRAQKLVSWVLTNRTQDAICGDNELPTCSLQLDAKQEELMKAPPPVMIESRSGTGKTLVLLKHAASYSCSTTEERPLCFLTVSPRLTKALQKEYDALNQLHQLTLKNALFFSFRDFLQMLVDVFDIHVFDEKSPCTFMGFHWSKSTHIKSKIDPHLVESEVGGVICGSLEAVLVRRPLSRSEYLRNKRSNVGQDLKDDVKTRDLVFNEYESYKRWKTENGLYDRGDLVLSLLQCSKMTQIFASGRESLSWVCAGDPAQMISPGCSFTFDGLKQTLLAISPGIESKLTSVSQLLVNYRTTKDILCFANKVLNVARTYFPENIPFAREEVANTDIGMRVVLCPWNIALGEANVELGTNQAVVFAGNEEDVLQTEMRNWIGSHPFVMTALDSKGLEFDDVIVAFDYERKVWNVQDCRLASLKMLRELYVAITRAKRRALILVKNDGMAGFLQSLGCDFQTEGASLVLQEFQTVTNVKDWFHRGKELLQDENFLLAARCFAMAKEVGWQHYANAKFDERKGHGNAAIQSYREALRIFGAARNYGHVIKVCSAMSDGLSKANVTLSPDEKEVIQRAIDSRVDLMDKRDLIRVALRTDLWSNINTSDLLIVSLSSLFFEFRHHKSLHQKVALAEKEGIIDKVKVSLPLVTADYYFSVDCYSSALELYLRFGTAREAVAATKSALKAAATQKPGAESVLGSVVDCWVSQNVQSRDPVLVALLGLFTGPKLLSPTQCSDCLNMLGRHAIIQGVDYHQMCDRSLLQKFSTTQFRTEISDCLVKLHKMTDLAVVDWFSNCGDTDSAWDFVNRKLKQWKDNEWHQIMMLLFQQPFWFFEELGRKKRLSLTIIELIACPTVLESELRVTCKSLFGFWKTQVNSDKSTLQMLLAVLGRALAALEHKGAIKHRNRTKFGNTEVSMTDFVPALYRVWPAETFTRQQRKPGAHVLNQEMCSALLEAVLRFCSSQHAKEELLHQCQKCNVHNKASLSLVDISVRHQCFDVALSVSAGVSKSKKNATQRHERLLSVWMKEISLNQHRFPWTGDAGVDIMAFLLPFSSNIDTKALFSLIEMGLAANCDRILLLCCTAAFVHEALVDKRYELCLRMTAAACKQPQEIVGALGAWVQQNFLLIGQAQQWNTVTFVLMLVDDHGLLEIAPEDFLVRLFQKLGTKCTVRLLQWLWPKPKPDDLLKRGKHGSAATKQASKIPAMNLAAQKWISSMNKPATVNKRAQGVANGPTPISAYLAWEPSRSTVPFAPLAGSEQLSHEATEYTAEHHSSLDSSNDIETVQQDDTKIANAVASPGNKKQKNKKKRNNNKKKQKKR